MDLKLMRMLLFVLCTLFDSMIALNHTSAEAECREDGGLASYRHFFGDERSGLNNGYGLKEGESAWISGYVKFSKFVAYFGCYSERREEVFKYELEDNNIYNCLQNCSQKVNITFIGIRSKFCYCANRKNLANLISKPDSDCNQELFYSNLESNIYAFSINTEEKDTVGKETKTNISLYRIIDENYLHKPVTEAQCVKSWFDNGAIRYGTESCDYKADSFICTKSAHTSPLSTECETLYNTNVCYVSKSSTWLTSFKECLKYKRKLVNFVYDKMYLTANQSSWTGIFRTFKIETKSRITDNNVCLSVRKVSGKIVFDPADCSVEKKFICEEKFPKNTESTSIKTDVDTKKYLVSVSSFFSTTVSATKFVTSKIMSTTQTKIGDEKLDLIGVYIAAGVVFTVALIIIITCITFRKRSQMRNTINHHRSDSHDNTLADDLAQRQFPVYQNVEDEVALSTTYTALNQINVDDNNYDELHIDGSGDTREATIQADTVTKDKHVYGNTTI